MSFYYSVFPFVEVGTSLQRCYIPCCSWYQQWSWSPKQTFKNKYFPRQKQITQLCTGLEWQHTWLLEGPSTQSGSALHGLDEEKQQVQKWKYPKRKLDGRFQVTSASGKVHKVDFGKETGVPSCTCLDWMRFHIPCKHFFAIFSNETDSSWYSLPPTYLASPLLSSDQEALLGTFARANDAVDGGPLDLLAKTHEEVSQQPCKQPQDRLPEKQVTNSS